jgi:hypothetical protein
MAKKKSTTKNDKTAKGKAATAKATTKKGAPKKGKAPEKSSGWFCELCGEKAKNPHEHAQEHKVEASKKENVTYPLPQVILMKYDENGIVCGKKVL